MGPIYFDIAAGPESLEDYFQKGALFGRKVALNFGTSIPGQIRKNYSRAFKGPSYLAYKILKKAYVYSYNFLFT